MEDEEEYKPIEGDETLKIGPEISQLVYRGKYYGEDVALKALAPSDRHKREIKILMDLSSHRNLIRYMGSRVTAANWYLIMELCYHKNLYQLIAYNSDLTESCILTILLQISQGLKYIHDSGIIHRDMKPQNILIGTKGTLLKICDFGFSKEADDKSSPKTQTFIGTEKWWSPESQQGATMSSKSDVYSLGLIFFYVIASGCQLPIESTDQRQEETLQRFYSTAGPINDSIGGSFRRLSCSLIQTMLKRKKEERPDMSLVLSHPIFWNDLQKLDFLSFITYLADKMPVESWQYSDGTNFPEDVNIIGNTQVSASGHEIHSIRVDTATTMKQAVDSFRDGKSVFKSPQEIWDHHLSKYPNILLDGIKLLSLLPESDLRDLRTPNLTAKVLLPFPPKITGVQHTINGNKLFLTWEPSTCSKYRIEVQPVRLKKEGISEGEKANQPEDENNKNQRSPAEIFYCNDTNRLSVDLKFSTVYDVTVCAQNAEGMNGEKAQLKNICYESYSLQELSAEARPESIFIQWLKPPLTIGGYIITKDDIEKLEPNETVRVGPKDTCCEFLDFSPSVKYRIEVKAVDSDDKCIAEGKVVVYAHPYPPQCVKAERSGYIRVTVSWDRGENRGRAVTYVVQGVCDGSHDIFMKETRETTIEYPKLIPNRTYKFWVHASAGEKRSRWVASNQVLMHLEPLVIDVVDATTGPKSLAVHWKNSPCKHNHFKVIRHSAKTKKLISIDKVSPDNNSFAFVSFIGSEEYMVEVQAIDSEGVCVAKGNTAVCAPPTKPVDLSVKNHEECIHLKWELQPMVSEYKIEVYRNGQLTKSDLFKENQYLFIPKKIDYSSRYFFKLTPTNHKKLVGPILKTASTTLKPPPPSKLQAYSDLYHITISWIMKPIAVKYQIRLSLMSVNDKVESMHTFETEETEYTFDNLKPASTYSVAVNAISISGIEGDERSTKFITNPSKLLKVTANILDGVLTLNWIKNINESNVRVSVQAIEESTGKVKPRVDNERDGVIVDWLNPSTCYTFKVSAMHGDKMGPPTVLRNIRMPPSVIKEISYSKDDKSITFTWKPLVNIKSQRFHYQWYCNEFIVKEEDTWEKSAVLHVEPSKEYYITVCTDDGQGQRGKQLTSNKVHTGPKPVVITLTSSSSREVWTEWRKLNDGSKYYVEVFCNGSKLGTRKLVHESTFKTNAKPGHKYHFQVSAVNKFGQEGPKSQSSIVETAYVSDLQPFPSDTEVLSSRTSMDSSRPLSGRRETRLRRICCCFCFGSRK